VLFPEGKNDFQRCGNDTHTQYGKELVPLAQKMKIKIGWF
jgi:hypothetical protein